MKSIIVIAICLFGNGIIQKAYSADSWIDLKRAKVSFDKPQNWKSFKNLLGFPLVLVGPMKKDAKKWISTKDGSIKEFFPYKKVTWKNTGNVHSYGFRYNLGEIAFVEHSYYLHCQGQLFHIKTLYREKLFKHDEKKINTVLDSFNCQSKVRSFK